MKHNLSCFFGSEPFYVWLKGLPEPPKLEEIMWFWRIFLHFLLKLNRGPSLAGSVGSGRRHWRGKQDVWVQFTAPPQPSPRTLDKLLMGSSKCFGSPICRAAITVLLPALAAPSTTTRPCATCASHVWHRGAPSFHQAPATVFLQGKYCEPWQSHILDISIHRADKTCTRMSQSCQQRALSTSIYVCRNGFSQDGFF